MLVYTWSAILACQLAAADGWGVGQLHIRHTVVSAIASKDVRIDGVERAYLMSKWRQLAFELFPQHRHGLFGFQRSDVSLYDVFFELFDEAKQFHSLGNEEGLKPIYTFGEWCFAQRHRAPTIWNAAATAFYEHLADDDALSAAIPYWVPEPIFVAMRDEFAKRRERCGSGKFSLLLQRYNAVRQTSVQ